MTRNYKVSIRRLKIKLETGITIGRLLFQLIAYLTCLRQ